MISGFIIPYSLHASNYHIERFHRFIARRMIRLEPPYLLSIAIVIFLWHLSALTPGFRGEQPNYTLLQILSHFLYLVPLTNFSWLNVVYWTLAYEFVFYIFVGLTFPIIAKKGNNLFRMAAYITILFAVTAGYASPLFLLFALGVTGFRFYMKIIDPLEFAILVALLGATIFVASGSPTAIVAIASCLFIVFVRIAEFALLRFLATISYSLYLLHVPVGGRIVNLGRRFCDGSICDFSLSLIALIICVVVAAAFCRFVELPARTLSRRISIN